MGKIGKYDTEVEWHRLGSSKNRIPRITITDPVKVAITAAWIEATIGDD
jgi:hypothetical protein